jgi:chromate transporter
MIVLGMLYTRYGSLPESRGALTGLAAAAAGLLIATSVSMAETLPRQGLGAVLVAVAALVGVGVLQWPLLAVLVVLVPISVARVWRTA